MNELPSDCQHVLAQLQACCPARAKEQAQWRLVATAALWDSVVPQYGICWYFGEVSKTPGVQAYTAEHESPALLQQEFYAVQAARPDLSGPDGLEGFSIRANAASREVVAVLEIEEGSSLELAVKLPPASPLRPAEAECRRRV